MSNKKGIIPEILETWYNERKELRKLEKKYKNPIVRMLMYWIISICRPRKEMARNYPILNKAPILLPFFWE